MTALFASSHTSKLAAAHNSIEFKAGKLQLHGTTVTADKRKGKFKLQFNADNLLQLTWTDRGTNKVEDDFVILPDEVDFVRIDQCTSGRVFLLKWKDHPRRLFFWLQESDETKDDSLFKRISDLITNPKPLSGSSGSSRDRPIAASNFLEELTRLHNSSGLGNKSRSHQELYDLFRAISPTGISVFLPQGEGAAAAFASALSAAGSGGSDTVGPDDGSADDKEGTDALANVTSIPTGISDIITSGGSSPFRGPSTQPPTNDPAIDSYRSALKEAIRRARDPEGYRIAAAEAARIHEITNAADLKLPFPDLSRMLSWQNLSGFFCEHPEELEPLRRLLPETRPRTNNEVIDSLQCPQFGNAKREIASIIKSRQFGAIATQFGITSSVVNTTLNAGNLIGFCREMDRLLGPQLAQAEQTDNPTPVANETVQQQPSAGQSQTDDGGNEATQPEDGGSDEDTVMDDLD